MGETNNSNSKFKVLVLASGRGSNLAALLQYQNSYCIYAVISDIKDAEALDKAKQARVEIVESFPRENYAAKSEQKAAIYKRIKELSPDLICLAGFFQIIDASFIDEFFGKIINIHPSLLPALPGLHTHKRALENKLEQHGCTVHYVDSGIDTGPIIAQAKCEVFESDTEETLSARVLALEHKIYPLVVSAIASKEIKITASRPYKIEYSERIKTILNNNQF